MNKLKKYGKTIFVVFIMLAATSVSVVCGSKIEKNTEDNLVTAGTTEELVLKESDIDTLEQAVQELENEDELDTWHDDERLARIRK